MAALFYLLLFFFLLLQFLLVQLSSCVLTGGFFFTISLLSTFPLGEEGHYAGEDVDQGEDGVGGEDQAR